jgi:hypothetical protein
MIAAGPPNKKGGYSAHLSQTEKTNSSPLIQQLRFAKRLDLVSWQCRVDNILAEFIRTGHDFPVLAPNHQVRIHLLYLLCH